MEVELGLDRFLQGEILWRAPPCGKHEPSDIILSLWASGSCLRLILLCSKWTLNLDTLREQAQRYVVLLKAASSSTNTVVEHHTFQPNNMKGDCDLNIKHYL